MYWFFVTVHAQPPDAKAGAEVVVDGRKVTTLGIAPETLSATTFDRSFEKALEELNHLERMYCEPDGSFVWVSRVGEPAWQVDGNVYDHGGRLLFVDLKGTCPAGQFDRLLAAFGWPQVRVMFQLTREAVFLSELEFRRFAAGAASAK